MGVCVINYLNRRVYIIFAIVTIDILHSKCIKVHIHLTKLKKYSSQLRYKTRE